MAILGVKAVTKQLTLVREKPPPQILRSAVRQSQDEVRDVVLASLVVHRVGIRVHLEIVQAIDKRERCGESILEAKV